MPRKSASKTPKQLLAENEELHIRLEEVEEILSAIRSGEVDALIISGDDGEKIFTLKEAEDALAESEEKFRKLVESLPSVVYMNEVGLTGAMIYVSPQISAHLGYTPEEWLADPHLWSKSIHVDDYQHVTTGVASQGNEPFDMEYRMHTRDGRMIWVHDQSLLVYDLMGRPKFRQGIMLDITARKDTEDALQESEEKFRRLVEHLPTVVYLNAVGDASSTIYVSPQIETLLGYTPQEWVSDTKLWIQALHPEDRQQVLKYIAETDQNHKPFEMEYRMYTRDGHLIWVHDEAVLVNDLNGEPQFWQGIMLDITQRKQAEEELNEAETAMRESDERFRQVWQTTSDAMALSDSQGIVLANNPAYLSLYGYPSEQVIGKSFAVIFPEENREGAVAQYKIIFANDHIPATFESAIRREDGTERLVETHITFLSAGGQRTAMLSTIRDITERKRAEAEIHQRLSELEVLYQSGLALGELVNPRAIAQKMIDLLDKQMDWHHTAIRLYDQQNETLELLVFNKPNLLTQEEHDSVEERLKTGLSYSAGGLSGWAIEHDKVVRSDDLQNDPRYIEIFPGLRSGLYVPIKTKEGVIGVISIESERHQAFSESDERLASTLAMQAAIAIENAQLFTNLKRSNIDLGLAYNATIEGWSRALDLRDKETEGHSQRVTEMTVNLARSFGLSEKELGQVRWGALLHDIGKMGVPDGILLKPGSLTEDEWAAMKKHPRFAFDLLSPIRYLRLALDIPYCHHEKWDGSGYPRGLKGEQIPLSARIFAVVDVWDALCSDRPYRAGWAKEKVREHILSLSGTHFDPQVVDAFMKVIEQVEHAPKNQSHVT
jgi:PAS domain S-box-containing protein